MTLEFEKARNQKLTLENAKLQKELQGAMRALFLITMQQRGEVRVSRAELERYDPQMAQMRWQKMINGDILIGARY